MALVPQPERGGALHGVETSSSSSAFARYLSMALRRWLAPSRRMDSRNPSYHGYRFPPEIISHAVWLYHRFCLSFRDTEDFLAQRGITVSYETIRQWCRTFGPGRRTPILRRRQGRGATDAIRTIAVPWYPELEYRSCDMCHYAWTVARAAMDRGQT